MEKTSEDIFLEMIPRDVWEYIKLAPVIFVRLINIYLTPPQNQSCRSHVQVPFYAQQRNSPERRMTWAVSREPSLNHGGKLIDFFVLRTSYTRQLIS